MTMRMTTITIPTAITCLALASILFGQTVNPTPPEAFGYKLGWIAVRGTDIRAVANSLPMRSQADANWHDGLAAAYNSDVVFVAPPVNGWILVVGQWSFGTGAQSSVEALTKTIAGLSARFGEVQGFGTHRVVDYHHWIMAKQGRLARCYAYVGDKGEVLCQSGAVTEAEKVRFGNKPPMQWSPDERDVMAIAGAWSVDPSKLSESSAAPALGIVGKIGTR